MRIFIAFFFVFSWVSHAQDFTLKGFTEAVFIVSDINKSSQFYQDYAGWEVHSKAQVSIELRQLWQLPQQAKLQQVLLANKGENRGYVRLIQIDNVPQQVIRANTQSWDVGGIFDVNVRVADMASKRKQLQDAGWRGTSDPVSFTFGPYEVSEWITSGFDGVSFALIQRHKPVLEGWPNLKHFSRVFNSTQVVNDIDSSLAFYRDVLGFKVYLQHKGASKEAGPNVLGLPFNLTTKIPRSVYILHPQKRNEGSIELLQFHGAQGKNVSELASPPNLGIVTLRFPVDNLAALRAHLIENKVEIVSQTSLTLAPYGQVDILAIRTPDRTWIEFYQVVDTIIK
ncbi:VOC family protein [Paraglaciecola agarilytica]|uniref:VOC family protein n=1 Tax=Paraglaciecola chathamensis TaxID=368405 RepID=UPI001C080A69|nr:VOC family protein [Paraglaciecola agarilytica]MBU3019187.1 VOC family protein [Paraglaciecola agarilytica]